MNKSLTLFLEDIKNERDYQITKWGTDADFTINAPMDFVGYIAYHSTRWFEGGFRPYSRETLENFKAEMVKVATLAAAAVESVDAILEGKVNRPDVLKVD